MSIPTPSRRRYCRRPTKCGGIGSPLLFAIIQRVFVCRAIRRRPFRFYKFVHTRGLLVLLFEQEPHYRQIFLDGRVHPQQADPTWMGHSVGKWEGDTLVVDTTGFNDKSWLLFATGLPHTEMLHMVERYRRPDLGHLLVDLRLEDPGTFTKPLERHMTWELAPGEEILEDICNENNKFPEYAGLK